MSHAILGALFGSGRSWVLGDTAAHRLTGLWQPTYHWGSLWQCWPQAATVP